MAEVKIDIEAMGQLVSSLTSARRDATEAASEIKNNLDLVWLSAPALDKVASFAADVDTALRDLNRRLTLARMIEKSTPGLSVVSFDDSMLSDASDAEIQKRVARVLALMKVDDDDFGKERDIDPELSKLLQDNALDPYFAKALAQRLDPETLRRYLYGTNAKRFMTRTPDEIKDFDQRYDTLLRGLGQSLSLASRGTGDLAVPGMTKQWTDYIKGDGSHRGIPGVQLLAPVIERGEWSDGFLTGVYHAIRETEGDSGTEQWALGGPDQVWDPDLSRSPGAHIMNDPMYGVMKALQSSPSAMAKLFTGGETTTLNTRTTCLQPVNKELYDFIRNRGELDEDTMKAFMGAITSAIASPPLAGQKAFQPLLANDIKNIGTKLDDDAKAAEEEAGPWWKQLGHGLLDLVGLIPVIGEPADFVNGVWYYADGDVINGSLSMGSAIPFAGWAAVGGKWVKRGLEVEELAKLNRLARDGKNIRIFAKDGKALEHVDLGDPRNFDPERFLSPEELARWSGDNAWMRKVIAGNRFNAFLNPRYRFAEIALTTGRKSRFRLDAYTPGESIVSRKLTQFGDIADSTAFKYIDEFATKYPVGTPIANTVKNRELGLAGKKLEGQMNLEVPPQSAPIKPEILEHAFENNIHIVDVNGHDYTKALFDGHH